MGETLHVPDADAAWLISRLPSESDIQSAMSRSRPFVTLTFATSMDSSLSLAPGVRTRLSGPESKAMTHHLRRYHAAILVGVGTVIADDPGLNCRIEGAGLDAQPRPIVLDPNGRWDFTESSKVFDIARAGKGLAPFIFTRPEVIKPERKALLEAHGGKFVDVGIKNPDSRFGWLSILSSLQSEGLYSVMIEGGGHVINSLLHPKHHDFVDSVITESRDKAAYLFPLLASRTRPGDSLEKTWSSVDRCVTNPRPRKKASHLRRRATSRNGSAPNKEYHSN
ncbi:2,5-diamino-6-ribosylamino-4(3H)-pyrimidinone 5'-phosphate reductase [Colletotrichum orbiculare MAFF 240422]|uniref:2,5-diamino-6-ribosylamino-4(3H)-pyrimidinone 5'-phosphate reductase n=1 Tax=Colletotrichum orbiculare (strain 104-T / ATCC 96160 / CBS 514.97 / LARS 414 / MAFF 240422) TaxID=1213857 RepID=A0A484G8G8_COLOR|nr:2,5-diamino-6-ribosylamino-4(3H)-pyrimidinone 5'-phosphate reductase [Colletotrichum orbiculare MAFF 240422]